MFRVFDVNPCHPFSKVAVFLPCKRVSLPTNRVVIRTPQSRSFPVRCSSKGRNFFVPMQCDERSLQNINDFVGSIGQPVRH